MLRHATFISMTKGSDFSVAFFYNIECITIKGGEKKMKFNNMICVRINDEEYKRLNQLQNELLTENTSETIRELIKRVK